MKYIKFHNYRNFLWSVFMTVARASWREDFEFCLQEHAVPNPTLDFTPRRLPIRADFPHAVPLSRWSGLDILDMIDAELRKVGSNAREPQTIYIVYPHKHPILYPDSYNSAEDIALSLEKRLKDVSSKIKFVVVHSLVETRHLGRSENQTSIHALMHHQQYTLFQHAACARDDFFLKQGSAVRGRFIIADWTIEQGTTIANMISFLEQNGQHVLCAVSDDSTSRISLAHRETVEDSVPFSLHTAFNTAVAKKPELCGLAEAFAGSARKDGYHWTNERCLSVFHQALTLNSHAVFSLTSGECERLSNRLRRGEDSFIPLLKVLAPTLPLPAKGLKKNRLPARGG